MRVKNPISNDLLHSDIEIFFEKGNQGESLGIETFISEHDLDKYETIGLRFPHFELSLTEPPPHETLLVVYFERLTVLLLGEVEETDH